MITKRCQAASASPSSARSRSTSSRSDSTRRRAVSSRSSSLVVVQAEDSSADAYGLLTSQIEDLRSDMSLDLDYLGIVVNHYDARAATSPLPPSRRGWA